jgi:hypothetical protein
VGFCDGQKWRWGRFSQRTSVFPPNLHSIYFSTIIFSIIRGWHNRPGVAAVPIASQNKIKKKKLKRIKIKCQCFLYLWKHQVPLPHCMIPHFEISRVFGQKRKSLEIGERNRRPYYLLQSPLLNVSTSLLCYNRKKRGFTIVSQHRERRNWIYTNLKLQLLNGLQNCCHFSLQLYHSCDRHFQDFRLQRAGFLQFIISNEQVRAKILVLIKLWKSTLLKIKTTSPKHQRWPPLMEFLRLTASKAAIHAVTKKGHVRMSLHYPQGHSL